MKPKLRTYKQKMDQTTKEALIAVGALGVVIVGWWVFGFGFSNLDLWIFNTPIWVFAGTIGTWLLTIAVCVILAFVLYRNFSLDDEDDGDDPQDEA